MSIVVKDSGTDKTVANVYAQQSNTDKEVNEVWVYHSGVDEQVFPDGPVIEDGGYYVGIIDSTQTEGNSGKRYKLILAPVASSQSYEEWGGYGSDVSGSDSKWDGKQNTADLISDGGHPAAEFCDDLNINGYSDWYLPAADELELIYRTFKPDNDSNETSSVNLYGYGSGYNPNSDPQGSSYTENDPAQTEYSDWQSGNDEEFSTSIDYFSSTENSSTGAWKQGFDVGYQKPVPKDEHNREYVRAVRQEII